MGAIVIAHRGASGYRPEHTLASYELGARLGADYIEPDLVSTRDGVLVARHENEISDTTDVASRPEFASRRVTKVIDGRELTGWFTEDFTLAELKTLRARERIPELRPENTAYDGRFEIPTFQEVIDLAGSLSRELGRTIGVYPETKHPGWFDAIGLSLEEPLMATLSANGLDRRGAPVFIQSFAPENLRELHADGVELPLVQLLAPRQAALATPSGLDAVATYADAIGPDKSMIVPRDASGRSLPPTTLVRDAHRAGLAVHPYTFRRENRFLPAELRSSAGPGEPGDLAAEIGQFLALGVDGFFTDNADVGAAARG